MVSIRLLTAGLVVAVGAGLVLMGSSDQAAATADTGLTEAQFAPVMGDEAPAPCKRASFKTSLVKAACKKGQKAAAKAMKGFVKKAKAATGDKVTCKTCHSKLKPDYPLKATGLETFKKYQAAIKGLSPAEIDAVEAYTGR